MVQQHCSWWELTVAAEGSPHPHRRRRIPPSSSELEDVVEGKGSRMCCRLGLVGRKKAPSFVSKRILPNKSDLQGTAPRAHRNSRPSARARKAMQAFDAATTYIHCELPYDRVR